MITNGIIATALAILILVTFIPFALRHDLSAIVAPEAHAEDVLTA